MTIGVERCLHCMPLRARRPERVSSRWCTVWHQDSAALTQDHAARLARSEAPDTFVPTPILLTCGEATKGLVVRLARRVRRRLAVRPVAGCRVDESGGSSTRQHTNVVVWFTKKRLSGSTGSLLVPLTGGCRLHGMCSILMGRGAVPFLRRPLAKQRSRSLVSYRAGLPPNVVHLR
jgi:hypothetical protein